MKRKILSTVIAGLLGTLAVPAGAAEYWLCAKATTKTMPDGAVVTMWGYVQDDDANLGNDCPGAATVPGPALTVGGTGDTTPTALTIHLRNDLSGPGTEPVSIVVPGLVGAMTPIGTGTRITSFTNQAATAGGLADYSWTNVPAGSYLYHSGTHPAVQVQMGLYGAVIKNNAAGQAYPAGPAGSPNTSFAAESTVLLSEVDPVLHAAVAGGTYGSSLTSTIDYKPKYFLVNGTAVTTPVTTPTEIASPNQPTLLRLINAGLKSHSMVIDGLRQTVVAEDGKLAPYPKDQAAVLVGAQQTADVMITPTADRDYALYDRIGISSTNSVNQFGGLFAVFNPAAPTFAAVPDSYATNEDTALNVAAPGVLGNDPTATTASLGTGPTHALSFVLNANGSFSYTPNSNYNGPDSFTYTASNGTSTAIATVSLTVNPVNDPPVANAGADQTITLPATATLTGTAPDVDGPSLTTTWSTVSGPGTVTFGNANLLSTSATFAAAGGYVLQLTANDGVAPAVTDVVQITVNAAVSPSVYFSTLGNTNPPGVGGTADNSDIYLWNGTAFSRMVNIANNGGGESGFITNPVPGGANVDELKIISTSPLRFLVSFDADATITVPGPDPTFQDEDIVEYNNGTWSVFFNGTPGLGANANQDIDAFSIAAPGSTISATNPLYFSTIGNSNPTGLGGTADDADVYSWNGTAFSRVVNIANNGGGETGFITNPVPAGANVDGLKFVDTTHFYLSFVDDVILPGLGTVQDEDIVYYNNGTWSVYFDGTAAGLTSTNATAAGNLDIDGFDFP